jgi:hypothetical protein
MHLNESLKNESICKDVWALQNRFQVDEILIFSYFQINGSIEHTCVHYNCVYQ